MTAPDASTVEPNPAARPPAGSSPPVLPAGVPWYRRPRDLPRAVAALCIERARAEAEYEQRTRARQQAADAALREQSSKIEAARTRGLAEAKATFEAAQAAAVQSYETDKAVIDQDSKTRRADLIAKAQQITADAESRRESVRWEANALFEAQQRGETERYEQLRNAIETEASGLEQLEAQAHDFQLQFGRLWPTNLPGATGPTDGNAGADPLASLRAALNAAEESLQTIASSKAAPAVAGSNAAWLFVVPWLLAVAPAVFVLGVPLGLAAATALAVLLGSALTFGLTGRARLTLGQHVPVLQQGLERARHLLPESRAWAEQAHRTQAEAIQAKRDREVQRVEGVIVARLAEVESRREQGLRELEHGSRNRLNEIQGRREKSLIEAENSRDARLKSVEESHASATAALQTEQARVRQDAETRRQREWDALVQRWGGGMAEVEQAVEQIQRESRQRFPAWNAGAAGDGTLWRPATEVPPALRFGSLALDLNAVPHGLSKNEALRGLARDRYDLPALLTFPEKGSLVIEASGAGREAANAVLQGAMLRYLTGLPPGKVRFTIIDPVGLGRNFAAFMHLADYSELLVNGRIWTEPQQIEQRLADLSLHMENVIQQYLRNEYATLDEYNRQAGEVAEPYRVLVVADFPANFQEPTAQRLLSIATSGARCGVHVLMSVDTDRPLPTGFALADLDPHSVRLKWEQDHFVWRDPDFAPFKLEPDMPPPNDRLTSLLHEVGAAAQQANKVEVPFEVVVPPRERWWQGDTRAGIDLPLGRSGATKLQHLQLGRGTAQHVLIAGRTGSGKSSLLHALITNAALNYSPDQVELYLIDFKKGVEFKTYAQYELPHARVIAIESEREFGLSVLQRLDEELKRRGDLFRQLGVQDLNGYRGLPDAAPLPRVLLIVDEFQEFFVEDDKLAQEVALLLDRLVRQGRAFGVHVHLGSQTLSGAYSLARSTLGQMGVRIALQCPEADAHLILSEDNAAARLLTRPGEAIYNDANGLVEGNHIFQVVWLPDDRREHYLKQVQELARSHAPLTPRPQIVFEGNIPADLRKNHLLRARLDAPDWPEPPKAAHAWLGDAVAIKDPTAAVFRRMGGNNLLVVGQDGEAARGLFFAAILGLAAQYPPGAVKFTVLDGTPEDDPEAGRFSQLAGVVPHPFQVGSFRDVGRFIGELSQDLAARQAGATGTPSAFLFLYDHSRFRDLRKSEDDYSFSFSKKADEVPANPSKGLLDLVKEGPALGIHTLSWFDTLNNLNRSFDRGGLREFEMRVLFQMNANDSSQLIDSPLANRLGPNRALFVSEEQGKLEKFRPYGLPPAEWLQTASVLFRKHPLKDAPLPPTLDP